MSDGNHINIGSMGDANHINIAQHHSLQPTAIQFDIDTSSVERLSRKNVNKGAVGFFLSLPLLALSFMSIVADAFGILFVFQHRIESPGLRDHGFCDARFTVF